MSSTPEDNELASDIPEVKQAKERLQSLGELLLDASTLIELLHTTHRANYIDYRLTFPILPYSTAVLPNVISAESPDYIVVTAGMNKASNEEPIISSVAIDVVTPTRKLKIIRDSTSTESDEDDVLMDTQTPEEASTESEDEFQGQFTDIPKISRREVNALLMSLALPDKGEYLSFEDKNLLDANTFVYLIESLRHNAITTNTSGSYIFNDGDTELHFTKDNNDVSFYMSYLDPRTNQAIIANIDTRSGFALSFSTFDGEAVVKSSPSNEDIELFHSIINGEITAITGSGEVPYDTTKSADAENIAISHIAQQEENDSEAIYNELGLDQDGFDTPDART